MYSTLRNSAAAAVVALAGLTSTSAISAEVPQYHGIPNFLTYQDMQEHLGMVPAFFHLFPEAKLAGLWQEYKATHLNPATALDARTKQLIGLAVAAQAKCGSCMYFHASAAFASGASFKEVQETVAISVIGGHWSEFLTEDAFQMVKEDTNALVKLGVFDAPVASN